MTRFIRILALSILGLNQFPFVYSQAENLPLLSIDDLKYQGAFRLPNGTFGESNSNYAGGPIEYNFEDNSIFIVGHKQHQAIAQFPVPPLVNSTVLADLNTSSTPIQIFSKVLDRATSGNTQNVNHISGIEYVNNKLIVNGYEFYDANGDVRHTTLVIQKATDLASSIVKGYYELTGRARASGWISPIPTEWATILGGSHISGHSSGIPIFGRLSVGPSAFAINIADLTNATSSSGPISAKEILGFNLDNPLHSDLTNESGENDLWTQLSRASYGFIVPGTRTYLTIGYSGGHDSGVGYKLARDDGTHCPGYCPKEEADSKNYYWLWDVNDMLDVKKGIIQPYAVKPYDYGIFPAPFQSTENGRNPIGGGTFDPTSRILYLTILDGDTEVKYSSLPVVVAYQVSKPISNTVIPVPPTNLTIHR